MVAEAGSNHNGDLELAFELIHAAADAGCDAVKFQVFSADRLMSRTGPTAAYLRDALGRRTLFDLFSSTQIDRSWLPVLADRSRERGIHFLATPFDIEAVDALVDKGVSVPAIKNASSELWHLPLIRSAAATGVPLLLSTGMADIGDVEDAVTAAKEGGARELCLLHCTVAYPTRPEGLNLRAMATLREHFGTPVGLSDHSTGTWAPVAAVALGADVIEKHLTISRSLEGPDHAFALEPTELGDLVVAIRATERSLGDGRKIRQSDEEEIYRIGRRNLVASRALTADAVVVDGDLDVLRSTLGIAPRDLPLVTGRRLRRDVEAGQALRWEDLA